MNYKQEDVKAFNKKLKELGFNITDAQAINLLTTIGAQPNQSVNSWLQAFYAYVSANGSNLGNITGAISTPAATSTPRATQTPTPSATPQATPTAPFKTPTPQKTSTSPANQTPYPSATPTAGATRTPTIIPTPTQFFQTPVPTQGSTATAVQTPYPTATVSPAATPKPPTSKTATPLPTTVGKPQATKSPQTIKSNATDPMAMDLPGSYPVIASDPMAMDRPGSGYVLTGDPMAMDRPGSGYMRPADPMAMDRPGSGYMRPGDPMAMDLPGAGYVRPNDPMAMDLPGSYPTRTTDPMVMDLPGSYPMTGTKSTISPENTVGPQYAVRIGDQTWTAAQAPGLFANANTLTSGVLSGLGMADTPTMRSIYAPSMANVDDLSFLIQWANQPVMGTEFDSENPLALITQQDRADSAVDLLRSQQGAGYDPRYLMGLYVSSILDPNSMGAETYSNTTPANQVEDFATRMSMFMMNGNPAMEPVLTSMIRQAGNEYLLNGYEHPLGFAGWLVENTSIGAWIKQYIDGGM
jgi:hypothetical protein